jgi:hypothetical protein
VISAAELAPTEASSATAPTHRRDSMTTSTLDQSGRTAGSFKSKARAGAGKAADYLQLRAIAARCRAKALYLN